MTVTFTCSTDDGHPSDLKMAELLNRHGLAGTFYIPIHNCEGGSVMSSAQIRILSQQFEIGSHTYSHRFLSQVNIEQAKFEIMKGKTVLEDILGQHVVGFCYPGGKFRQEHALLVKSSGFLYARTAMNLCFDAGSNQYEMATTCQFYPHQRAVFLRNFVRGGRWLSRHEGLVLAFNRNNWLARTYALFDHACENDAIFHLWCHSEDIDKLNAWDDLDEFFAYVQACVPRQNRLSNEQLAQRFFPATCETAHNLSPIHDISR